MQPIARQPRRRHATVVVGVVVVVAAAVLIGGLELSHPTRSAPPAAACIVATPPSTGGVAAASQAPGGGGLRVDDQGFTQVGSGGLTVSLGAVVENTSKRVAYRTRITFRVLDAHHGSAVAAGSGELLTQEIPVIVPGQRLGVGAWTYVRDAPSGRPVAVAGFQLDLGATQWLTQPGGTGAFVQIATRHLSTQRSSVERETGTVRYTAVSAYCRAVVSRGVATVFRDAAGKVDGGSLDLDKSPPQCQPGTSTGSTNAFRSIPPDIDDSKTESYPYCDVAAGGAGPTTSGLPIN
jgi:hypothetical protein